MSDEPIVAVRGEVVREVEPELAQFSVNVSARDKDRQTTLARLAQRIEALKAVIGEYPDVVERRETSGMHVYPENKKQGERVVGYTGNVSTTLTVNDFSVLGDIMLRLADQDQTSVHGPWWSLRPDSPVYREARRAAIDDAITRANEYAAALGARVVRLVQLADSGLGGGGGGAVPLGFASAAGFRGGGGMEDVHLDLDPQRQTVRAEIEARFAITAPTRISGPAGEPASA